MDTYIRTDYAGRFNLPPQERLKWEQEVDELKAHIRAQEYQIEEQKKTIDKQSTALYNAEISKDMLKRELEKYNGKPVVDNKERYWAIRPDCHSYFAADIQPAFLLSQMEAASRALHKNKVDKKEDTRMNIPEPRQVIYSGPKTIIMWPDGSKTMVSPSEDQQIDDYAAFCAAITKKLFGSTHKAKKFLAKVRKDQKKKEKKSCDGDSCPITPDVEDPDWEGK